MTLKTCDQVGKLIGCNEILQKFLSIAHLEISTLYRDSVKPRRLTDRMTGDEINFKQSHGATRFCVIVAYLVGQYPRTDIF
jgi:hypothetical protein